MAEILDPSDPVRETRADAKLLHRAIREQWPIPPQAKQFLAAKAAILATEAANANGGKGDLRTFIPLMKLLTEMNRQNVFFGLAMLDKETDPNEGTKVVELPAWAPIRRAKSLPAQPKAKEGDNGKG